MEKLILRSLTTGYSTSHGKVVIQKNLDATLCEGEFVCMLGPNGAGKTTLLRTLSGFLPPLEGSVLIDGRELSQIAPRELAKKIGVVLTERPSVSSMTAEQLVGLGRSPYTGFWGRITDRDRSVIKEALDAVGGAGLADRLVDTLSDGERQKVMTAKALAQQTPLIFLDEPTAFLDYPSKAEMMRMLRDLAHKHAKIVFLSTHDVNMALALADKIWLVDRVLGVVTGTPRELALNGHMQRYFLRPGLCFNQDTMMFSVE